MMQNDPRDFKRYLESLSREEIEEGNAINDEEHFRQSKAFLEAHRDHRCYLCGKPFKTISKSKPCVHWLLRECKFKKKDFPKIWERFSYHEIAAFLRWCANQERFLSNINDLSNEKTENKILSYTIKWRKVEWTFDCSRSDFHGHKGTNFYYPHYHFQMRIDGRPFINFKDFHIPFTDEDQNYLYLKSEESDLFHHSFGGIGAGMQDAVDVPLENILEFTTPVDKEDEATYHFSTMVSAHNNPLSEEEIQKIFQEAKYNGKPLAFVAQQRLQERADVKTIVSPVETIPEIANRSQRKKR
jgi:hypothetical protein